MVAKQTTPMAKAIRTLEGQLVLLSDAILGAGAAFAPHQLPPKLAAIVIGAQHIALLVQRGVLKAQASKHVNEILDSAQPLKQTAVEIEEWLGEPPPAAEVLEKPLESAVTPDPAAPVEPPAGA